MLLSLDPFLNLGSIKRTDCFQHIHSTVCKCPIPTGKAPFGQGSPSSSQTSSCFYNILSLPVPLAPSPSPSSSLSLTLFSREEDQTLNWSLISMFNAGPRDQLGQVALPLAGPFTAATAKLPSAPAPAPHSDMFPRSWDGPRWKLLIYSQFPLF